MTTMLVINGSPRKGGNTETVLNAFVAGAKEAGADVTTIRLVEIEHKNCKGCNACHKNGVCVIKDALTPVFDQMLESDILVLASPIYSMTVTAEMKSFIDRGQFLWAQKFIRKTLVFDAAHLKKHKGVFLGTSGQNLPYIFDSAFPVVRAFFNDSGFSYADNVLFPGMDKHGGVQGWPESVVEAKKRGKEIVMKMNA
ncbi:MAG: flavodoxin family protein [Methanocorpusculum sp.]|uniref:flavodoxin family protein n=1 Tax=Methanocorpusculum sp. TaxID=2058474 RepID=UPI00271F916D|nr:flavodoxin family protein [Methanocorpusculum sp.]MDO9522732.1 flavodoxin family protein [Methanocorpusculum sp.]